MKFTMGLGLGLALALAACGGSDEQGAATQTTADAASDAKQTPVEAGADGAAHADARADAAADATAEVTADGSTQDADATTITDGADASGDVNTVDAADTADSLDTGDALADADGASTEAGDATGSDGGACYLDQDVHAGNATAYEVPSTESTCYLDLSTGSVKRAALGDTDFAGSGACGTCIEVAGPTGTANVRVTDQCPACNAGDLEVTDDVMSVIGGATSGNFAVTWRAIPCMANGNVFYEFVATNPYFIHVRFMNHTNPIASVAMQSGEGGGFSPMTRQADNYFQFVPSGDAVAPPVTFRLTDSFGQTIDVVAATLDDGTVTDGGEQFPGECAP